MKRKSPFSPLTSHLSPLFLAFCLLLMAGVYTYYYVEYKPHFDGHKVVVCIPVYGQSLALGEEASLVTDLRRLKTDYGGRIVTERLDYDFGFFDNDLPKQCLKRLFRYYKRTFELSVYHMAETLAGQLGEDTLICIFPGGRGATPIADLGKGSGPYTRFLDDIKTASANAAGKGWDFYVPAICWMQGESDIADYPDTDYKELLHKFCADINNDIREITLQREPVRIICYQTNAVSRGLDYDASRFDCREMEVPQAQMELIRDDSLFVGSGPTYPYSFARELIHLDAMGQRRMGELEAESALRIIRHEEPMPGLLPTVVSGEGCEISIGFSVPCPPLQFDTLEVRDPGFYGFSVVNSEGVNVISRVAVEGSVVRIGCQEGVAGCRVRYGVNGELMKSGRERGPRGCLRDSRGHWCYQWQADV